MFCENCGTQLPDNTAFCSECGYKVSFKESETKINELRSTGQRGPVPPVKRPTEHRQPSELYGKEATPRRPSEPYEKRSEPRNKPVSDRSEYNKTDYQGADIISFGQYVLMIFLAGIPIINIILLLKWGFSAKQNPNKRNFAKALLFYYLIAVIIYVAYILLWLKATSSI